MDFSIFKGKRVLVTGSTGFKGSWLCTWLNQLGADVAGFALPPKDDAPLFDQLKLRERIDQHDGDIRDLATVKAVFDKVQPEIVIHLAAQALVRDSYDDPKTTFDTNVGGATNLLEAVNACETIKALVFITSDKCYRNKEWIWGYRENDELGGHDPYSGSKAAAELVFASYQDSFFAHREGFAAATTRAGNVIGGGDFSANRIVPDCIRSLQAGEEIVLRSPNATRPWQHVLEPLSGYLVIARELLLNAEATRGAWNFGPEPENVRTVEELTQKAIDVWGAGALRVEAADAKFHEANLLMLNIDKAKTKVNWHPQWDFEEAVEKTVSWYKRVDEGEDPIAVTEEQLATYLDGAK
ncbi:CDP-glucose 4,6-dehydratase [Terasakiella sp. A23]|uniref:CDP-glucose 4,6-dehydratase n=1 Tax=Terasakiella sp. FCG-A23 TaxID=3080561 RepID=UPI00295488F8|nr:CDP-glucose 4,6-dehydratase [Terasakiella sp. A23]MDV7340820.1 CDP-glucose 4,6-dehydratase [Terasakiella sp. A23]